MRKRHGISFVFLTYFQAVDVDGKLAEGVVVDGVRVHNLVQLTMFS